MVQKREYFTIWFDKPLIPQGYDRKIVLTNVWPSMANSYPKRGSSVKYNSGAITGTPQITGLIEFRFGSSTKYVCTAGTEIYKDDGDGTWDEITKAAFDLTAGTLTSMVTLNDILCIFQVGGTAQQWDGAAANTSDLSAGAHTDDAFAVVHEGRVFSAGATATPDTVNYTDVGDPTTAGGSFDIYLKDGLGGVTGLASGRFHKLYVFKKYGIYEVDTTTVGSAVVTPLYIGEGTPSHWSICNVMNDIWFLTNKPSIASLKTLTAVDAVRLAEVSLPYEDTFTGQLAEANLGKAHATVFGPRNAYLLALPETGQTNNNLIVGCNYHRKEWFWHRGLTTSVLAVMEKSNKETLFAGDYAGFVRYLDQTTTGYQDDSTAISAEIRIPTAMFGSAHQRWQFREFMLHHKPQEASSEIAVTVTIDDGTPLNLTIDSSGNRATFPYTLPFTLADVPKVRTKSVEEEEAGNGRYFDFLMEQAGNYGFEPYGLTIGVVAYTGGTD